MAGDTVVTLVGNLVDDPELRFTPSGAAVANFRVASTPRKYNSQSGEWEDGEALFLSCSVWRQAAENVAESLQRGTRVIVQGRLKSRSYDDREGNKRTVFEIDVDEVGPSLRNATAKVTRASRDQGVTNGPVDRSTNQGVNDPWASAPANNSPQSGGWGSTTNGADEPPF
jgi:single-strand DNA-binding protein